MGGGLAGEEISIDISRIHVLAIRKRPASDIMRAYSRMTKQVKFDWQPRQKSGEWGCLGDWDFARIDDIVQPNQDQIQPHTFVHKSGQKSFHRVPDNGQQSKWVKFHPESLRQHCSKPVKLVELILILAHSGNRIIFLDRQTGGGPDLAPLPVKISARCNETVFIKEQTDDGLEHHGHGLLDDARHDTVLWSKLPMAQMPKMD